MPNSCSKIVEAKAPGATQLRKLVRGLVGPLENLINSPKPEYWPSFLVYPPKVSNYSQVKKDDLISIVIFYAGYANWYSDRYLMNFLREVYKIAPQAPLRFCCPGHSHLHIFDQWVVTISHTSPFVPQAESDDPFCEQTQTEVHFPSAVESPSAHETLNVDDTPSADETSIADETSSAKDADECPGEIPRAKRQRSNVDRRCEG